jgi:general secretion pathway protein I
MKRSSRRAFSLLEVMVAIAILGLTMTVILSAQGGLAATNKSAANMGTALNLGKCRMTEMEEKLLKLGYPEIDEIDSSTTCCDDKEVPGFSCEWRVERVILPQPSPVGGADGGFLSLGGSLGEGGVPSIPGLPGAPGAPTDNPLGGAALNFDGGVPALSNITAQVSQMGGGAGAAGMLTMVFGIVYPSLKPLLEQSIRRLTVTIKWHEGLRERELPFVQYVSNPARAGFAQGTSLDGGVILDGGLPPSAGGGGGAGGAGGGGFGGAPPGGVGAGGGFGSPIGGSPNRPGTLQ